MDDDAIILHFDATGRYDPLRAPGTAPDDVGRPVGWDDANAVTVATWPQPDPALVDTRTKAPAPTHLYWPHSLQLAYPAGSLVPVELLPKLLNADEYEQRMHPPVELEFHQPKRKPRKR